LLLLLPVLFGLLVMSPARRTNGSGGREEAAGARQGARDIEANGQLFAFACGGGDVALAAAAVVSWLREHAPRGLGVGLREEEAVACGDFRARRREEAMDERRSSVCCAPCRAALCCVGVASLSCPVWVAAC
jgi:hypothetical protein